MSKNKTNFVEILEENRMPIIFVIIIAVFFTIMFALGQNNKIDLSKINISKPIIASEQTGNISDHIFEKSAKNSKAVLIEYGDFQCPSCAIMSAKLKTISEKYTDKLTVIFRNFPLEGHANALSAAAAAEAAGLQGKYWEMHETLFENQTKWGTSSPSTRTDLYKKYAAQIGVQDEAKFIEDMKASNISKKIKFDKNLGKESKVNGTPTLILNGKELSNEIWGDDAKLAEEIDKAIK